MDGFKVLYVKRYSFGNPNGELVEGCKVSYVEEKSPAINPNEEGYPILEISGAIDLFNKFTQVPGKYDLDFRMKPGKNNKPVLELKDAKLIHEIDFSKKGA